MNIALFTAILILIIASEQALAQIHGCAPMKEAIRESAGCTNVGKRREQDVDLSEMDAKSFLTADNKRWIDLVWKFWESIREECLVNCDYEEIEEYREDHEDETCPELAKYWNEADCHSEGHVAPPP